MAGWEDPTTLIMVGKGNELGLGTLVEELERGFYKANLMHSTDFFSEELMSLMDGGKF